MSPVPSSQDKISAQEETLKRHFKISTDADYLQAHLTVIERETHGRNPTLHDVKQRVALILKHLTLAANALVFQQSGK
jgi:hypothetical protein